MEIKVTIANLEEIRASLMRSPEIVARHINRAINRSILDIHRASRDTTPARTGHLAGTYQLKVEGLKGEIGPTAKYNIWVHQGTGIYAVNGDGRKTPWRYKDKDGWHFTRGQRPNPYLQKAVDQTQEKITKNFEEGLSDALNEIAK
jgi:hypothetical protein